MTKPKIIVFSGGCYSGKTTSINVVKSILESRGKHVKCLSELIRSHNIGSIDEIRSNPNKYMELQNDIINGKIESEKFSYSNFDEDTIILVDRSITDSLFYLTFYVNKNALDTEHRELFVNLFHTVNNYLYEVNDIYTYIFEFKPLLNIVEEDSFRPQNLTEFQPVEYEMIKKYNMLYFNNHNGYLKVDLNDVGLDNMIDFWTKILDTLNL